MSSRHVAANMFSHHGLFDDLGRYTRRTGITVQYWQGWRARQELLDMIANARSRYARLKNALVPQTVREVRQSGASVSHGSSATAEGSIMAQRQTRMRVQ